LARGLDELRNLHLLRTARRRITITNLAALRDLATGRPRTANGPHERRQVPDRRCWVIEHRFTRWTFLVLRVVRTSFLPARTRDGQSQEITADNGEVR